MDITPEPTTPDPQYPQRPKKRRQRTVPPALGGEPYPVIPAPPRFNKCSGVVMPIDLPEYQLTKSESRLLSNIKKYGAGETKARILNTRITNEQDAKALKSRLAKFDKIIQFMKENAIDIPE